jgi:type I restriction enzyme S subunit
MAGEWDEAPLDELVDEIVDRRGVTPLKLGSAFVAHGYRVISAKAIKGRRVDLGSDEPRFVNAATYRKWMKSSLRADDVILTSEAPLGEPAYLAEDVEWCLGQRLFGIRTKKARLQGRFLFYALQSERVRHDLLSRATGTTAQGIRQTELRLVRIPLPSVDEQRAIAHIVGTLDDKIELNRRMSETLEAMARALFKSWFVDFDPVRAKAEGRDPGLPQPLADLFPDSFEDSELGEIPRGWKVGPVESLCESITSGGTPARMNPLYWDGGSIPWFKTGELVDGPLIESEEHITDAALEESSCKLWPAGTILFALYASPTVGRLGVLTRPGTSNQAAAGLIAKPTTGVPFLRRLLLDARVKLQTIAVGAAQQNINQAVLKTHRAVMPTEKVASAYSRLVAGGDERQVSLAKESSTLTSLRDALLPKLISGELRVENPARFLGGGD